MSLYDLYIELNGGNEYCDCANAIPLEVAKADYSLENPEKIYAYLFALVRNERHWAIFAFPEEYGEEDCRKTFAISEDGVKYLKYIKPSGLPQEIPNNYEKEGWIVGP